MNTSIKHIIKEEYSYKKNHKHKQTLTLVYLCKNILKLGQHITGYMFKFANYKHIKRANFITSHLKYFQHLNVFYYKYIEV